VLELASVTVPEVILMAVGLSDLDGIRAARKIMRAKPVPIILVSSHYDAETVERARRGKRVVRLKGGDPFAFGRGGEEAEALRRAGISYEIAPGVSSAIAVPAYAGIPLTHGASASSVAIVTGHKASNNDRQVKWRELARSVDTLVILMGLHSLSEIMSWLLEDGCEPQRPVALIQSGTRPSQKSVVGTVATIADLAEGERFQPPIVDVVGEVVKLGRDLHWFSEAVFQQYKKVPENIVEIRV
jgi:uroporphyrin-III C-methyltransferase